METVFRLADLKLDEDNPRILRANSGEGKMKNLLFLIPLTTFLLTGCAMGINHNVATINGVPYLIETKNYGFLIEQWSAPSQLVLLEDPELKQPAKTDRAAAQAELARIADECNVKTVTQQSRPNYKKTYKCLIDRLAL